MSGFEICLPAVAGRPRRCFPIPVLIRPRIPGDPGPVEHLADPLRELQVLLTIDALIRELPDETARGIGRGVADGIAAVEKGLAEGATLSRAAAS